TKMCKNYETRENGECATHAVQLRDRQGRINYIHDRAISRLIRATDDRKITRSMVETVQFVAEYPDGGRQEAEGRSSHGRRDDGASGRSDAADGGRPLSISLQKMTKSTIDKVAVHIIES
ncbi:hypothetical protein PENTCL1PPCAC_491, partial [Pristionchus entomophagus]